jgi:hypothetical protein
MLGAATIARNNNKSPNRGITCHESRSGDESKAVDVCCLANLYGKWAVFARGYEVRRFIAVFD